MDNDESNGENIVPSKELEVRIPNWEEIQTATNTLKNNKATREDKINTELWKAGGHKLKIHIFKLIQKIWKKEKIPEG